MEQFIAAETRSVTTVKTYSRAKVERITFSVVSTSQALSLVHIFIILVIDAVNVLNMLSDHAIPVALVVEDRVSILRRLTVATGKSIAVLPEQITSDTLCIHSGLLPRVLVFAAITTTICMLY